MALSSVTGCATTYTVTESTEPVTRWLDAEKAPSYTTNVAVAQNDVQLQVRALSCTRQYEVGTLEHGKIYKKKTFFAGPVVLLGGLAAGGLAAGLFASAKNAPATCADNDDKCLSQDDVRGFAVVASGLAAAGLIVGTYNTFKGPLFVGPAQDKYTRQQQITSDCTPSVAGIDVALATGARSLVRGPTDAAGNATFSLDDSVIAMWPNVVDLYVSEHLVTGVDLSSFVNPARTRLIDRLRIESAANEQMQPPPPPPPPPPGEQTSPAADDEDVGWIRWARSAIYEFMIENPSVCEEVVSASADLAVTATFSEEELTAELVTRFLGERHARAIAAVILPVLHRTRIARDIAETFERAKAQGARAACNMIEELIKP